jgi:hypothetical protein
MTNTFCADAARQAGEDMIGSANYYQTYVLLECPMPWHTEALESPAIPANLKGLAVKIKQTKRSVKFLLINQHQRKKDTSIKVIIYDRQPPPFSGKFQKFEFNINGLEQAAELVKNYLSGRMSDCDSHSSPARDFLICTHGSHDQCCARYGTPFYMQATAMVKDLCLTDVRIWKTSHFGGHRFAPTAIAFPDGRYYGGLDGESFRGILTRTGSMNHIQRVYRGWSFLPAEIQVLERDLFMQQGWEWLRCQVSYRMLEQRQDQAYLKVEMTCETPSGSVNVYRAEIVKDDCRTMCVKGSCGAAKESKFVKYAVASLELLQPILSR